MSETWTENDRKVNSIPWAVIVDYNRLPDKIDIDEKVMFNNSYELEKSNLPDFEWFQWKDNIRDWIIVATSPRMNPDLKEWLDEAEKRWIPVEVMAIDETWNNLMTYNWATWSFEVVSASFENLSGV